MQGTVECKSIMPAQCSAGCIWEEEEWGAKGMGREEVRCCARLEDLWNFFLSFGEAAVSESFRYEIKKEHRTRYRSSFLLQACVYMNAQRYPLHPLCCSFSLWASSLASWRTGNIIIFLHKRPTHCRWQNT